MATNYLNELEKADLQEDLPSTLSSLHDLRQLYYRGRLGLTNGSYSDNELIRSFLQRETDSPDIYSLYDLWKKYLIMQGVTDRPSLTDMLKEFFSGDGNPDPLTFFLLLETGDNALLEDGFRIIL